MPSSLLDLAEALVSCLLHHWLSFCTSFLMASQSNPHQISDLLSFHGSPRHLGQSTLLSILHRALQDLALLPFPPLFLCLIFFAFDLPS